MNSNTNNYCIDPVSRRTSLCPPHHENHVLSPPLTPALSQHHPYDKRHSTDLSYHHYHRPSYPIDPWINQHSMYPPYNLQSPIPTSQMPNNTQRSSVLINNRTKSASSGSRKQPTKQNKHACTFPECSWSFKRFEHLKRHMLVHTGERPHVCPHPGCGKRFSRSDNFHAHYRTHEKKAFARQKQQQQQQDPHASSSTSTSSSAATPTSSSFIMKEEKEFYYSSSYALLPKEQDSFINQYPQDSNYSPTPSSKIKVEEDKKPHACTHPNCDKRFRRLEHLKRHTRIHTQEQPFKCNFPGCLKAFSRSDNLAQHKKTHERRESRYGNNSSPIESFIHQEQFTLVDLIRDNNTDTNNSFHDKQQQQQNSLMNWQHPNDSTESVGC
ncbi:uncharacterized protein B0P05DRAFT_536470 [Gilbertella persicaria]|uniref:uncharacterized protein n=1 Tax=Gilbertella persicaria TaxID=101096 RepID=UPI0022200E51|nr:uncharacterized protein B0P05DRAFT_536470 [Gilbertella persicaria]KAI8083204.1 hypothetical protein B0P05DRAFT_536470 [Gilbertella persicaria]